MTPSNISLNDYVAGFSPQGLPVRGRLVKMQSASLSPILKRHAYPDHLAEILGQALMLSVLVGSGMKFQGKLLVQAEGDGPVSMLVGEYRKDGGVRGYCKHEPERWAWLEKVNKGDKPHMPQLFGPMGRLGLIILQDDPNTQPYQGIVPLVKGSMAECAREYFRQSEQVETHLMMAIEKDAAGDWRGGGMVIQRIASDEARGDTEEGWREAEALFATLKGEELLDEALTAEQLLYRLFHEGGVSMDAPEPIVDACTCNQQRLVDTLTGISDEALHDMVEETGMLEVNCQFCARTYSIPVADVTGAVS